MSDIILFEGLDGSGKSGNLLLSQETLNSLNIPNVVVREPGGTQIAEKIRTIIKADEPNEEMTDIAELLLFYAARAQIIEHINQQEPDTIILCDRSYITTLAYQCAGRGIDESIVRSLNEIVLKNYKPNLIIYLDVDPEVGLKRAQGRGSLDRIEKSNLAFFQRARQKYLSICAQNENAVVIDANMPQQDVSDEVIKHITSYLRSKKSIEC